MISDITSFGEIEKGVQGLRNEFERKLESFITKAAFKA